jgi:hypothetical protein
VITEAQGPQKLFRILLLLLLLLLYFYYYCPSVLETVEFGFLLGAHVTSPRSIAVLVNALQLGVFLPQTHFIKKTAIFSKSYTYLRAKFLASSFSFFCFCFVLFSSVLSYCR